MSSDIGFTSLDIKQYGKLKNEKAFQVLIVVFFIGSIAGTAMMIGWTASNSKASSHQTDKPEDTKNFDEIFIPGVVLASLFTIGIFGMIFYIHEYGGPPVEFPK